MTEALEPCPFCGSAKVTEKEYRHAPRVNGPDVLLSVEIRHWCDGSSFKDGGMTIKASGIDHDAARRAWNRRADDDQIPSLRRALHDAQARLRGAGMLGGNDDSVNAAIREVEG